MYRPAYYDEKDQTALAGLIDAYPFATLVTAKPALWATHLPLIRSRGQRGASTLIGHLAKANPQWRKVSTGDEVLAIFNGPDAYISPRWYADAPDVPTWNYAAVHVRAAWRDVDDPGRTRDILEETVRVFEARFERPWSLGALDPTLVKELELGVTAFELDISSIVGVQKMGQDKSPTDVDGVVKGLNATGGHGECEVAKNMSRANAKKHTG